MSATRGRTRPVGRRRERRADEAPRSRPKERTRASGASGQEAIDLSWLEGAYGGAAGNALGDLRRDPHAGVRVCVCAEVTVVIAAASRDESELGGDALHCLGRGRVERSVIDLEAAEAGVDQLLHDVGP